MNPEHKRFFKFVLLNGCSATLTVFVRFLFSLALPFELAVIFAHIVGMTIAFTLNRVFVFSASTGVIRQYGRFVTVNIVSLVITTLVSTLFYRVIFPDIGLTQYSALLAHFLGLSATALPSYLGHRFFSFRVPPEEKSVSQL